MYNYQNKNCWEHMQCPEEMRKHCWAYRLNLGKECWILKSKNPNHNFYNKIECKDCSYYQIYNNTSIGALKSHL